MLEVKYQTRVPLKLANLFISEMTSMNGKDNLGFSDNDEESIIRDSNKKGKGLYNLLHFNREK